MKELSKAIATYEKTAKMLEHTLVVGRMDIGTALRNERMKKKISLREMARRLDVSAPYLSDIELGRRNLSSKLYDKLKKL